MKTMKKVFAIAYSLFAINCSAQFGDKMKNGLTYYLDSKDSARFIRLNMCTQIWTRFTEDNPGTQVSGYNQAYTSDVSVRRIRLVLSGALTDRINFFAQFGENSMNYTTARKSGAFFHDVTADYAVIKRAFSLGFGLNGWTGPSRFSNTSVSSIMALDPPNFQETTNDTYDQFVRMYGIYAKGKIGKLDYRLSASKPFIANTNGVPATTGSTGSAIAALNSSGANTSANYYGSTTNYSTFSTAPPNLVYKGYVMYQFLDEESNFGPSMTGTYLGKKRILNIGAGFYYQKDAMMINTQTKSGATADTMKQDIMHWAVDVFYDAPINKEKGNAISFYGSFSSYNYGTNFLRIQGADNPATGAASYTTTLQNNKPLTNTPYGKNNYGNAVPYLGTGNTIYAQAGYKFKDSLLGKQGTLQVYANCQYSIYNALGDPMVLGDVGINWLIKGHSSKFTLDYQSRPHFSENNVGQLKQDGRYGQMVLQYQVAF